MIAEAKNRLVQNLSGGFFTFKKMGMAWNVLGVWAIIY